MTPLIAYGPDVKIDDGTGHFTMRFVDPESGPANPYLLEGTITDREMDVGDQKLPRVRTVQSKLPACTFGK